MSRSLSAFMLVGLVLLFVVVGTAGAASRESVLYAFHGKDGWNGGSVIADSARQFVRNDGRWGQEHLPRFRRHRLRGGLPIGTGCEWQVARNRASCLRRH